MSKKSCFARIYFRESAILKIFARIYFRDWVTFKFFAKIYFRDFGHSLDFPIGLLKRAPSGLPLPRPPKAKKAKKLFRRIEERRDQPSKKTVIEL